MTIQIEKHADKLVSEKTKEKSVLTAEEQQLVDELAELEEKIAPIRPLLKEFEEKKKVLASVALDKTRFDAAKPAKLVGKKGIVEFGPESHDRTIKDMDGLIGSLKEKVGGYQNLLPLLKVNITDVDKYLTPAEQEGIVGYKPEGKRTCKSVRNKDE